MKGLNENKSSALSPLRTKLKIPYLLSNKYTLSLIDLISTNENSFLPKVVKSTGVSLTNGFSYSSLIYLYIST